MKKVVAAWLFAGLSVLFFGLMYQETWILRPVWPLGLALVSLACYGLTFFQSVKSILIECLLLLSATLWGVMGAGSFVYFNWPFEQAFSSGGMMKLTLILAGTLTVFANGLHLSMKCSQKKQRKRELVTSAPIKTSKKLFRKKAKKQPEVSIVLGEEVKSRLT